MIKEGKRESFYPWIGIQPYRRISSKTEVNTTPRQHVLYTIKLVKKFNFSPIRKSLDGLVAQTNIISENHALCSEHNGKSFHLSFFKAPEIAHSFLFLQQHHPLNMLIKVVHLNIVIACMSSSQSVFLSFIHFQYLSSFCYLRAKLCCF